MLFAAFWLFVRPSPALRVAGVDVPAHTRLAGQTLELASCGVRDTLWVDHYIAALYLEPGANAQQAMLDAGQAKLVDLRIVGVHRLPDQIPEQWRSALRDELASDALARVRAAYHGLRAGDRVELGYAPGHGVSLSVNARLVAQDAGHGVFAAMLRAWADGDPISGKLHRLLLRHPCELAPGESSGAPRSTRR